MIDNIITNTLLPALSREFLKLAMDKQEVNKAHVSIENDDFAYVVT
jgi:type VI secretion system protein VasG